MAGKKAFDVTTVEGFKFAPEDVVIIGLDTDDTRAHPLCKPVRNERALDEEFVQSIMVNGVVNPIVVRKADDGRALVVEGRQRIKGAREANRRLAAEGSERRIIVVAIQRKQDDGGVMGAMAATTLKAPESVNDKARDAAQMFNLGMGEEMIAASFGTTVATVKAWIRKAERMDATGRVRLRIETPVVESDRPTKGELKKMMVDMRLPLAVRATLSFAVHGSGHPRLEMLLREIRGGSTFNEDEAHAAEANLAKSQQQTSPTA